LDPDAVRTRVRSDSPAGYAELIDSVFRCYAEQRGKVRWGDKTPRYVQGIGYLAQLFPHSRFIHVIRDGREVAASLGEQRWGPSAVSGAFWWRRMVRAGRRSGGKLAAERYMELHLRDLIADPEGELRRVCDFLEEDYDPVMLDYPSRHGYPAEHAGSAVRHLFKPPSPGLRDWRAGLSRGQQDAIEAACAPLLAELGYDRPSTRAVGARMRAWTDWSMTLARDVPAQIRKRLRIQSRDDARLGKDSS
jgi:hypothetical protein